MNYLINQVKGNETAHKTGYIALNLIGQTVLVQLKDGSEYTGILHRFDMKNGFGVSLKYARKVEKEELNNNSIRTKRAKTNFTVKPNDFVTIKAYEVDFFEDKKIISNNDNGFKTDKDISKNFKFRERELVRFDFDTSSSTLGGLDNELESFDQFKVNEQHGYKSTYDENIYTTPLPKIETEQDKRRAERAQRIANEIKKSGSKNIHVMEERNQDIKNSNYTEEELYGAVLTKSNSNNRYVIPSKRNKEIENNKEDELPSKNNSPQQQQNNDDNKNSDNSNDSNNDSNKTIINEESTNDNDNNTSINNNQTDNNSEQNKVNNNNIDTTNSPKQENNKDTNEKKNWKPMSASAKTFKPMSASAKSFVPSQKKVNNNPNPQPAVIPNVNKPNYVVYNRPMVPAGYPQAYPPQANNYHIRTSPHQHMHPGHAPMQPMYPRTHSYDPNYYPHTPPHNDQYKY